jgi:hypothetical protein
MVALSDLTEQQLLAGKRAAEKEAKGRMVLGRFRELCETSAPTTAAYKPFVQLPAPKSTPEDRKARMAELRRVTGV